MIPPWHQTLGRTSSSWAADSAGSTRRAALARAPVRVTVVDRRNHHLFQPLLYQVATAALSPPTSRSRSAAILRRPEERATSCWPRSRPSISAARQVSPPATARSPYDYLVLAAGARHAYFGHDDWEARAPGLKTLEDALEIRRRILLAFEEAERETDPSAGARC